MILISGLINIETTLRIEKFPLDYFPVTYPFFGINSTVSGVGFNVAKAIRTLGEKVLLLSVTGDDIYSEIVTKELINNNIDSFIVKKITNTAQSVVIYDKKGNRQIHTDLKNVQDFIYPMDNFYNAIDKVNMLALCNVNFSRQFLSIAKGKDKIIATDVHAISKVYDDYNSDFMRYADILFMSNEHFKNNEVDFIKRIGQVYKNEIIITGLGKQGALLYVKKDDFIGVIPAVNIREVVNTVGAGDALFSSFIYFYNKTKNPYISLEKAIVFAGYKIGEASASDGFLTESKLNDIYKNIQE